MEAGEFGAEALVDQEGVSRRALARDTVPEALEISAESDDGLVMGLRHTELPIEGVQFHPESILTEAGHSLLGNFLATARSRPLAAS